MSQSQILHVSSGYLNQVNDVLIGMAGVPGDGTGASKFTGQLGKELLLATDAVRFNAALGNIYGGRFQYVRLAAGAAVPVIGQIAFWDDSVAETLFQVTTAEGTPAGAGHAGIFLTPGLVAGRYTLIQTEGYVPVKFRATLTAAGTARAAVFAAAVGGADLGFADTMAAGNITDVLVRTYLGTAVDVPTNGGLTVVDLVRANPRG